MTVNDQHIAFKGPVPEGIYSINPREFSGGLIRDLLRGDGWGRYRVPLHPRPSTETHGRDGFFLHGDNRPDRPDSLGCVDIGDCDKWARDWALLRPDEPIPFTVFYRHGRVCN